MAGIGGTVMEGVKSDPYIKNEGDINMNSPLPDDIYEDEQGDIDFSQFNPEVFLARLPKYLWSSWDSLGDDEEIVVGTLRVEGPTEKPTAMSLRLNNDIPSFQMVPKDFVLQVANEKPPNTYVFTEEDLPGYSNRMKMSGKAGDTTNLPMSKAVPMGMRQSKPRPEAGRIDKTKARNGYSRRAVPKKTTLAGRIRTEMTCLPVENAEYGRIMKARLEAERHANRKVQSADSAKGNLAVLLGGGQSKVIENFTNKVQPKLKAQQNKNVRMAQNELLDALIGCFKQYRYWRIKDLRTKLQQPEVWVKQGLTDIGAYLVQSGPKNGTYALSESAQKMLHFAEGQVQDDEAPELPVEDADGDTKMEM